MADIGMFLIFRNVRSHHRTSKASGSSSPSLLGKTSPSLDNSHSNCGLGPQIDFGLGGLILNVEALDYRFPLCPSRKKRMMTSVLSPSFSDQSDREKSC